LFFDIGTPQFSHRLVCTYFLFFVCSLQGARALSTFVGRIKDPELSRLASCLPLRCLGAKAESTIQELLKILEFGLLVIRKLAFFHLIICLLLLI